MPIKTLTLRQIADLVGGSLAGDETLAIRGLAAIDQAGPEDLTFAVDAKRAASLAHSRAAAAIVPDGYEDASLARIHVPDVGAAIVAVLGAFAEPPDHPPVGIDAGARIADGADVDETAAIGPNVVIGSGVHVGPRCVLCANVVVEAGATLGEDVLLEPGVVIGARCELGPRVRIGPNSVIGSDGFGYHTAGGVHHKVPHTGKVVIEADVEIGACACVDRAKWGSTRIGAGTKIDNLVQVAHNVRMGPGCLLAAQVGLAGSCKLGAYVVMGGHAGAKDNITIGDQARCAAFCAIAQDLPGHEAYINIPAVPAREGLRSIKAVEKLPDLIQRVRALERKLREIETAKR